RIIGCLEDDAAAIGRERAVQDPELRNVRSGLTEESRAVALATIVESMMPGASEHSFNLAIFGCDAMDFLRTLVRLYIDPCTGTLPANIARKVPYVCDAQPTEPNLPIATTPPADPDDRDALTTAALERAILNQKIR